MSLFNVRLTPDIEQQLTTAAKQRGVSRSELVRSAITAHLTDTANERDTAQDITDDWSDFGSAVHDAHRNLLQSLVEQIETREWKSNIEPLYAMFRSKVIEKTRCYQTPSIFLDRANKPYLTAAIGFASDDIHEIKISLEQLFFEFCWHSGDEGFAQIPIAFQRAKERIDAGEPDVSHDQMVAARY